jgi:hypothetical protein
MPIRKFRDIESMKVPRWRDAGDPELFRAMAALWDLGRRTRRGHFPPGIHKHSSIEEMYSVQELWRSHMRY